MGLFSRKKKFTKEEKETLEKAREELKKNKDRNKVEASQPKVKKELGKKESPELREYTSEEIKKSLSKSLENNAEWKLPKDNINWKILNDPNPIVTEIGDSPDVEEIVKKIESQKTNEQRNIKIQKELEESYVSSAIDGARRENTHNFTKQNRICYALDCNVKESALNGKECKLCGNFVCIEHILPENHTCVKHIYVKYLRKQWLRKYGLNVSSGQYKVVCDDCSYQSDFSLIEISGKERENHILETGCNSNQVWLEGSE